MRGSVLFAKCFSPWTDNSWISVPKACRTWPAVPLKSICRPVGATPLTVKPSASSQPATAATSLLATPKCSANCAGVSHWW